MRSVIRSLFTITTVCFFVCLPVYATVVPRISLQEMLKTAEFIFEGEVVGLDSRFQGNTGIIQTEVTFRVRDIIKGLDPGSVVRLQFMGGTVGSYTVMPSDMHIPSLGEHGIYFVKNLKAKQIHPLSGWDQGRFLLKIDISGQEVVTAFNGTPITAIDATVRSTNLEASSGIALGLRLGKQGSASSMASATFKTSLRKLLRTVQ